MWFKKKKVEPKYENAYSLLNKELERMHHMFYSEFGKSSDAKNINIFWNRIIELQDALLKALEKHPTSADQIKDLQETVAEMLLLTDTESK
jgi:hypothetical protein